VAGLLGAALRARQLLVDRSLWVDEALLADNVLERGYRELLEPLGGQQGAPVGYLWLAKAITSVVGLDERWMRAPSLVAGIALLPLVWLLARRLSSARSAALAVVLVAVAPGLVRYSVEFKQYALDATIAVGLVLLAERVDRRRDAPHLALLAGAGAVAAWCSHPAVLVLAGIGLVLVVRPRRERSVPGVLRLVPVGATWAVSLGALWWVSLRDLTSNEFLTGYWQAGFPDGVAPHQLGGWAWSNTTFLLDLLGGFAVPGVGAVALLIGLATLLVRRRRSLALLLVPFPALVAAAVVEQYPYRARLALFTLPFLLAGIAGLGELGGRRRGVGHVALAAVVLLATAPAWRSASEALDPSPFPDSRPVLEALASRIEPGDGVYVHGLASAPFAVYGDDLGLELAGRTAWASEARCPLAPGPLDAGTGTVWIVFAYTHSGSPPDEAALLRSHLDARARRLDLVEAFDAFAARYDLAGPPAADAARTTPATGCLEVTPAGR